MKSKIGMLVYPVAYKDIPNGFKQTHLFSKGVFFTDQDIGWEYQEKMNESNNDELYAYWTNSLIPYDVVI